jgi:hypothetical protein
MLVLRHSSQFVSACQIGEVSRGQSRVMVDS